MQAIGLMGLRFQLHLSGFDFTVHSSLLTFAHGRLSPHCPPTGKLWQRDPRPSPRWLLVHRSGLPICA